MSMLSKSKTKCLFKLSFFVLIFLLFLCLDFYFSNLISYKLLHGWSYSNSLIRLIYVENTGAAFSIMQNSTAFLVILSAFALLAMLYYIIRHVETIGTSGSFFLAFLGAGILGNMVERLVLGHVRDFFDLVFMDFPIFNISDVFINIGVVGIIFLILLTKKPIQIL